MQEADAHALSFPFIRKEPQVDTQSWLFGMCMEQRGRKVRDERRCRKKNVLSTVNPATLKYLNRKPERKKRMQGWKIVFTLPVWSRIPRAMETEPLTSALLTSPPLHKHHHCHERNYVFWSIPGHMQRVKYSGFRKPVLNELLIQASSSHLLPLCGWAGELFIYLWYTHVRTCPPVTLLSSRLPPSPLTTSSTR